MSAVARRKLAQVASPLNRAEKIEAIFRLPALYSMGRLVPERSPVGRPLDYPGYALLGYGVLARLFRSGIAVQTELEHEATWRIIRDTVEEMNQTLPDGVGRPLPSLPPRWDSFRYARDRYLANATLLPKLQDTFTTEAITQARNMGLLLERGPGSWCHPDRTRSVYGDGTIVRPMYRPRADKESTRRVDPDAETHQRHDGAVVGQNFVGMHVRGDGPHQRVMLAVDRVPAPGREAETAVALFKRLHAIADGGIQTLIYDGALRGVHIDEVILQCGVLVINKVHDSSVTAGFPHFSVAF